MFNARRRVDHLIWWTTKEQAEQIGPKLPETFPEYLQEEWRNRYNAKSNQKQKLWIPPKFCVNGLVIEVYSWSDSEVGKTLATADGIVVDGIQFVCQLLGVITDLNLSVITPEYCI